MPETLDAQTASGAGAKVTLGGRELTLHPLTVGDLGDLQAWVHTQLPDPIKVAKELAEGLPAEVAKELALNAYEDVRSGARRLGSPEAVQLLNTLQGWRELLFLHGRKGQPSMTRDDWESVVLRAVEADLAQLQESLGEEKGGAVPDPKAPSSSPPTAAPSTSATSPSPSPSGTGGGLTG